MKSAFLIEKIYTSLLENLFSLAMNDSAEAVNKGGEIVGNVGMIFDEILDATGNVKQQSEAVQIAVELTNQRMELLLESAEEIACISSVRLKVSKRLRRQPSCKMQ